MTTFVLSKAAGHPDLDAVFAPYTTGTSPPATGVLVAGVDIASNRYAPIVQGTAAADTGILTEQAGNADISTLFAAAGTVQEVIASPGYSNLSSSAEGASGSQIYTATASIYLNSNGTWDEGTTNIPASGIWYQGAPITGIGDSYQVEYTVTGSLLVGNPAVIITNGAATFTALSSNISCQISLRYGAGGSSTKIANGDLQVQIANSSGVVLSNITLSVHLEVIID
ncbi:MAG: hypothetical protein ACYDBH_01475 [Acidobacteriaceae bacterium]